MNIKTYTISIEVDDRSQSDGEDIEEIFQMLIDGELPDGLPSDMQARILEVNDETN